MAISPPRVSFTPSVVTTYGLLFQGPLKDTGSLISKILELVRALQRCSARAVNDTVIVSSVKGTGTEVAGAGCTSYT